VIDEQTLVSSTGTKIVQEMWQRLRLELPAKRRPQLARFFAGFKPLHPVAFGSLLRAMARALIEADHVCITRDTPQDPVELIAAALEIAIEQWDRGGADIWNDVAIRIAAFERLYRVRAGDERLGAFARAVEAWSAGRTTEILVKAVDHARCEVAAVSSRSAHTDALLAEFVIVGRYPSDAAALAGIRLTALPLARAAVLVRAGRFSEALEVFEAIVDRVPGHTLALQQAARCCLECGAVADAQVYARRASGLIDARRGAR